MWVADACDAAGLEVPELDAALQARLRPHMPSYGSPRNPVDVTAEVVNRAGVAPPLELLASSPQIDAIVLISSLAGPHMLRGRKPRSGGCSHPPPNRSWCTHTPIRARPVWKPWPNWGWRGIRARLGPPGRFACSSTPADGIRHRGISGGEQSSPRSV